MALSNKEKQANLKAGRRSLGQKPREFWMTDEEAEILRPKIKEMIKKMRTFLNKDKMEK